MRKPTRHWRKWHRWGGLVVVLPVLVLVISGLLLNHTDSLELAEHRLPPSLAAWYGVELSPEVRVSPVTEPPLYHVGDRLLLGERVLADCPATYHGAVSLGRLIAVGCDDVLLLLAADGSLLERLGPAWGLPRFDGLGSYQDKAVLETPEGAVVLDPEQLTTRPLPADAQWQPALDEPASGTVSATFMERAVPAELNWERWLLDLHSGRLLGDVGVLIMDLAAVLLLALAITGLVVWTRSRARSR